MKDPVNEVASSVQQMTIFGGAKPRDENERRTNREERDGSESKSSQSSDERQGKSVLMLNSCGKICFLFLFAILLNHFI